MFESKRSIGIIGVIVAALVLLGVVFLQIRTTSSLTTTVLEVTQPVSAGQALNSSNVAIEHLRTDGQSFAFATSIPNGATASIDLTPGTLLQAGDFVSTKYGEVSISVASSSPSIVAGNVIDIYANVSGGGTPANATSVPSTSSASSTSSGNPVPNLAGLVLIGVGIPVLDANGNKITIQVPFTELTAWAVIAANSYNSGSNLTALVAVIADTNETPNITNNQTLPALSQLYNTVIGKSTKKS